jgi:hypothetical protein
MLVGWDQEQVLSLQPLDELGGVGTSGDRVAQWRAEPPENAGPEQELPYVGRLTIEYLFGQEVGDEPVVAGELIDKGVWRRMAAQGQRGQVHAGRPPLCPGEQCAQIRAVERDSRHRGHQRLGL